MAFVQGGTDLLQETDSMLGDPDQNLASVASRPSSLEQFPFFETVDHARDIRSPRNEAFCDYQGRQGVWGCSFQKSQHVVLLTGQVELVKQFFLNLPQAVVSSPEIEIEFLGRGIKTYRFPWVALRLAH
jgi:hypothetical protein